MAAVLALFGAVQGAWSSLWFVGGALALAVAAGATWRGATRLGDVVTVRAPLRRSRTVDVRRVEVRIDRSGYGRATTLSIGPGRDSVAVPIAVFTPSSRRQIVATAERMGRALDLHFDEGEWASWLAGRTLRGPRRRRSLRSGA